MSFYCFYWLDGLFESYIGGLVSIQCFLPGINTEAFLSLKLIIYSPTLSNSLSVCLSGWPHVGYYVGAECEATTGGHSEPVRTWASPITGGGPLSPGGERPGLQDQYSQRCVHTRTLSLYCTQIWHGFWCWIFQEVFELSLKYYCKFKIILDWNLQRAS